MLVVSSAVLERMVAVAAYGRSPGRWSDPGTGVWVSGSGVRC
jgi:hypothetical protein